MKQRPKADYPGKVWNGAKHIAIADSACGRRSTTAATGGGIEGLTLRGKGRWRSATIYGQQLALHHFGGRCRIGDGFRRQVIGVRRGKSSYDSSFRERIPPIMGLSSIDSALIILMLFMIS